MPPVNPNVRTRRKFRVEILPNKTKNRTIVSVKTTHDKKTGNLISSNVTTATYNSALPLEMAALSPKAGEIYPKLKDEPLLTNITKKTTEAKPVAKPSPAVTPAVTPVVVPPPPPAVTPAVTPAVIPPPPPAVTNDKEQAKSVVASVVSKKSNKPSVIKTPVKPLSKASSIAISGLGNMPAPSSIKSGKRSLGLALDGDDELNLGDNIISTPKKLKSNPSSASATSMSQLNQHNLEAMLGGSNTSKHITGGSILGSIIEGGSDIGGLDLNSMSSASKAKLAQIIANRSSRSSAIGSKLGLREDTSNINLDNIQGLADDNPESVKGLQDLLSNISGFSGGQPQLSPSQIQALNALNALNTNRSNRSSQVQQRSRQTSMAGSGLNGVEKASSINVNDIIQGLADDNPESAKGLQDLLSNISGFSGEKPQLSLSQIQALNALNALNGSRSNRSRQVQPRSRKTSMASFGEMSKKSVLPSQLQDLNEEQLKLSLAATSKAPSSVSKKNLARGNLSSGRRTNLTSNGAISKSVHYTPAPHEMIDPANESDSSDISTMVSIGKDVGNIKPRSNPRTPSRVSVNESVQLWKNQVVESKAPSFVSGLTHESGSTFSLPHNKLVKFKIHGSKIRIAPEPEESIAPSNSASNK